MVQIDVRALLLLHKKFLFGSDAVLWVYATDARLHDMVLQEIEDAFAQRIVLVMLED